MRGCLRGVRGGTSGSSIDGSTGIQISGDMEVGQGVHQVRRKASFRDMVLGGGQAPSFSLQGLPRPSKIEFQDGNRLLPRVLFNLMAIQALSIPWKDALVIKLLGKLISFLVIKENLRSVWQLKGEYEVMSLENGYFLRKFNLVDNREKVISSGPWMIADR